MDINTSIDDVKEGKMTRAIESETAKVPSLGYMGLAVGSIFLSAFTTLVLGKKQMGNFFGLWVPSFLLVGIYNKLVKMEANLERGTLH